MPAVRDRTRRPGTTLAPDTYLGVDGAATAPALVDDGDDSRRVQMRGLDGRLKGRLAPAAVDDDDERQHTSEGERAGIVAEADQSAGHGGGRRRGHVHDHGSLHRRPSRAIIASAPDGPQRPGS